MNSGPSKSVKLEWEAEVPLLTNRFIVYDLFKLVGITGLVFFVLLLGISLLAEGKINWESLGLWARITGWMMLGLLLLLVLVLLLFFFNRFPMKFSLSPQGAQVESLSRRGKLGNRLAVVLGVLSGKPGMAGAGLLGMAQETVALEWREVHRLNIHPQARVISLRNSWRVVFRLFCPPANFDTVLAAVRAWSEKGAKERESSALKAGPSPRPRQIVLSLLTLTAGLCLAALPLEVPPALKVALTLSGLLAIWLRSWSRGLGAVILALAAAILLAFVSQSLETRQLFQESDYRDYAASRGLKIEPIPDWALFKHRRGERFHTGEWMGTGVAGVGLVFFGFLGLAGVRGKLENLRSG